MTRVICMCVVLVCFIGIVRCNTSCPDVWVADNGSCYLFMPELSLSYLDAQHYCSVHKSHLVVVNDVNEGDFLKSYLKRLQTRNWWIGLTDELTEGHWSWYSTGESPEYTDWAPGEPDSNAGHLDEDCASMHHDNNYGYKWADILCTRTESPICEMEADFVGVIG